MLPVGDQVPVAGSYSSALANSALLLPPPATSTLPLGSKVAVSPSRAVPMLPVGVSAPVAGSNNSALAKVSPLVSVPPATSTLPLGSREAV